MTEKTKRFLWHEVEDFAARWAKPDGVNITQLGGGTKACVAALLLLVDSVAKRPAEPVPKPKPKPEPEPLARKSVPMDAFRQIGGRNRGRKR